MTVSGLGKRGQAVQDSYPTSQQHQPSMTLPTSITGQMLPEQVLYSPDRQLYSSYQPYFPNSPPKDSTMVGYPPSTPQQSNYHLYAANGSQSNQFLQSKSSGLLSAFPGVSAASSGPPSDFTKFSPPTTDAKAEKRRRVVPQPPISIQPQQSHLQSHQSHNGQDAPGTPLTPRTPQTPASTASVSSSGSISSFRLQPPPGLTPSIPKLEVPPRHELQKPNEVMLPKVVDSGPSDTTCDDDGGHYVFSKGERFAGRYTITRLLGQGTFGKVVEAYDDATGNSCAIKIIRAIPKYRDASKIELRVLTMVKRYDPYHQRQCIRMKECFDYRNHVCLVTDLLDISVYDFLKTNAFLPFPGHHIAQFTRQLLECVEYIHSLGIIHTDLKPENILLHQATHTTNQYRRGSRGTAKSRKELKDATITLIDFGSAIFDDEYHSNVVSTRHYRAPEIIFGTGWSFSCDMWSVGCVLVELCTGGVLFQTRDNLEHLHMMEKTLQCKFSSSQLSRARMTQAGQSLVDPTWNQLQVLTDERRQQSAAKQQSLAHLIQRSVPSARERAFWDGFIDLVRRLLVLEPSSRLTAAEALNHPWVREYAL